MERPREWCRITAFDAGGQLTASWVLRGEGAPDLGAVDSIAKQALAATRAGGRLVLAEVTPGLRELLLLAGLPVEVEGLSVEVGGLPVEVEGQPEGREQTLGVEEVEEEGHLGDLPA